MWRTPTAACLVCLKSGTFGGKRQRCVPPKGRTQVTAAGPPRGIGATWRLAHRAPLDPTCSYIRACAGRARGGVRGWGAGAPRGTVCWLAVHKNDAKDWRRFCTAARCSVISTRCGLVPRGGARPPPPPHPHNIPNIFHLLCCRKRGAQAMRGRVRGPRASGWPFQQWIGTPPSGPRAAPHFSTQLLLPANMLRAVSSQRGLCAFGGPLARAHRRGALRPTRSTARREGFGLET